MPNTTPRFVTQDMAPEDVKVGDKIYVGTSLYLGHGADDFIGGIATVQSIEHDARFEGTSDWFVTIQEDPKRAYNLRVLLREQDALRKRFGDHIAHPEPDMRPEFNEGW